MNIKTKVKCLSLLLFISNMVMAQRSYTLTGDMGVQGGELFTYKVILKDTSSGLTGYSYTYLQEGKEVKARVNATLDRDRKILHLTEKEIVYNHGFKSKAQICLVDCELIYDGATSLSGSLTTRTAILGASCAAGSITFLNKNEIEKLFSVETAIATNADNKMDTPKINPNITKQEKKPVRIIYDTIVSQPQQSFADTLIKISEGLSKTYKWQTDSIVIEIWDKYKVDNDRIQLKYNGDVILSDYDIKKDKKMIRLPTGGNELNIITITALNEGNEPPNTVNILLRDGEIHYQLEAYNTIGKSAMIRIEKVYK